MQNAEAALKEAKASGEKYLHHRVEMNSELAKRVGMEHRLRTALEDEQFELHYQPKITLRTGKIAGVEALLRWHDPENGLIAPGVFLPLLESAGLMTAIGAWVLEAGRCRLPPLAPHGTAARPNRRQHISAGAAAPQYGREMLEASAISWAIRDWGIDIEVTEGALVGDSSTCVHALRLLRAAGVRIAIDDFGTGFSSLGRLSELPIDTLEDRPLLHGPSARRPQGLHARIDHHRLGTCV